MVKQPPEHAGKEQRLLRQARREGLVILAAWAVALVWSVGSGVLLGYHRSAQSMHLILGMPDWVFWSVAFPWAICLAITVWFCFFFMADDDLGRDLDEEAGHG